MPIKIKLTREPLNRAFASQRYPKGRAYVKAATVTQGTDLDDDLGTVLCHDWAEHLRIPVDSSMEVLLYLGEDLGDAAPASAADRTIFLTLEEHWRTDEDGDEYHTVAVVVGFPGAQDDDEEVIEDYYQALETLIEAGLGGQVQVVFPASHPRGRLTAR